MFDTYLTAAVDQIREGKAKRERRSQDWSRRFLSRDAPHKLKTHDWLHDYLRLVIRIFNEREEQKTKTGSVDVDDVYGTNRKRLVEPSTSRYH